MFKMFSTLTLFGLLTVTAAYAESNQQIQAHIPFAFTVQPTRLAAGDYRLMYSSSSDILSIRGLDPNSGGAFATALPAPGAGGPGKLVFHCYGKSCYLAEVSQGGKAGASGLLLPNTAQERRLVFLTRVVSLTDAGR